MERDGPKEGVNKDDPKLETGSSEQADRTSDRDKGGGSDDCVCEDESKSENQVDGKVASDDQDASDHKDDSVDIDKDAGNGDEDKKEGGIGVSSAKDEDKSENVENAHSGSVGSDKASSEKEKLDTNDNEENDTGDKISAVTGDKGKVDSDDVKEVSSNETDKSGTIGTKKNGVQKGNKGKDDSVAKEKSDKDTSRVNEKEESVVVTLAETDESDRLATTDSDKIKNASDKSPDDGDAAVTESVEVRSTRKRVRAENTALMKDAATNGGDDLITTDDYTNSKRPTRGGTDGSPSIVVLGTVQSAMVEETTEDRECADQGVMTIKQENALEGVTKWVVGENGELVRMPAIRGEDSGASMNGFNPVGEPWTQAQTGAPYSPFPVEFTPETFPPQMNEQGFLVQIEDLRLGDETHEDVSDFLHIPTEAVDLWRGTKKCPVVNCKGPALTLKHFFDWHWYVFHETLIKVYYCPVSGCQRARERWNTRRKRDLVAHLTQKHGVDKLPDAIETQIIKNPNYKQPKNFVAHPSAPVSAAKKQAVKLAAKEAAKKKADLERTSKGMTKSGRVKKKPEELLSSYQSVQSEQVDQAILPDVEAAWKERKQCPCEGCPKTKFGFASEYRRHWAKVHIKYNAYYVCPDSECLVLDKGQQLQFQTRDLMGMTRHLTGSSHELSQAEAKQVSAALLPTMIDNPMYVEPIIRPADPPAKPVVKTPRVLKTPLAVAEAVDVNSPRSSRHGRRGREESPMPTPSASDTGGKKRGRALNRDGPDVDVPKPADTEFVPVLQKRGRPATVGRAVAEGATPAKKSKDTEASLGDVDSFENAKNEIIPSRFLDWWTEDNGCPSAPCKSAVCSFKINDLIRHWKLRHVQMVPFYRCTTVTCSYYTKNKRALKSHIVTKHHIRPGSVDNLILKKSVVYFDENADYEVPVPPAAVSSKPVLSKETPKARGKKSEVTNESDEELPVKETMWSEPEVLTVRSRSGKVVPGGKSAMAPTQLRGTPGRKPGPRSMRSAPEELPTTPLSLPVKKGASASRSSRTQKDGSLEQSAWQPTVHLISLRMTNPSGRVDITSPEYKAMIEGSRASINASIDTTIDTTVDTTVDTPQTRRGGRKRGHQQKTSLPSPAKKSPIKEQPPAPPLIAPVEPVITFEADDGNDNDFSVEVPMPSMEDAGIAISVHRPLPNKSALKSQGKASPAGHRQGNRAGNAALSGGGSGGDVSDYTAAILALKQRQQELERRLEDRAVQPVQGAGINADVLSKITELQSQNEALRFQNEALRKQLISGAMADKWAKEKKQLEEQVSHKDVTINTLQDVIARLGMGNPTTSNTITNQLINLPGSRPGTRSSGSIPNATSPPPRMSITPRADPSRDGALQKCSVSLKSGASVNFEYDSFGDFMQKIGTLNDQYGLND